MVFRYGMANMAGFLSLPSRIEECKKHLLVNDIPQILFGNKCNLQNAIQMLTDMSQKFTNTHSMPLFETCAKNPNDNGIVEATFVILAHEV